MAAKIVSWPMIGELTFHAPMGAKKSLLKITEELFAPTISQGANTIPDAAGGENFMKSAILDSVIHKYSTDLQGTEPL